MNSPDTSHDEQKQLIANQYQNQIRWIIGLAIIYNPFMIFLFSFGLIKWHVLLAIILSGSFTFYFLNKSIGVNYRNLKMLLCGVPKYVSYDELTIIKEHFSKDEYIYLNTHVVIFYSEDQLMKLKLYL